MKISGLLKRRLGISPAIALILLIGITIFAGAILFTILILNSSSDQSVGLAIELPKSFSSTETSRLFFDDKIDTFSVTITNPSLTIVAVDFNNSFVYNATNDEVLSEWSVSSTVNEIELIGFESSTVQFRTNAEMDLEELTIGDNIYVSFAVHSLDDSSLTEIRSDPVIVDDTNSAPFIVLLPVNSGTQFNNTVFFYGEDTDIITSNLSVTIWNFGNAKEKYELTSYLYLENTTLFTVNDSLVQQTITVPNSLVSGDANNNALCDIDEPCFELIIPITKQNYTRMKDSYSATLAISGLEIELFALNITSPPEIYISLPQDQQACIVDVCYYKQQTNQGGIRFIDKIKVSAILKIVFRSINPIDFTVTVNGIDSTYLQLDSLALQAISITSSGTPPTPQKEREFCNGESGCAEGWWNMTRLAKPTGKPIKYTFTIEIIGLDIFKSFEIAV
jgi:hypothetical protein